MQKLLVGIQTFSHIREENYIYIDKTEETYNLINTHSKSRLKAMMELILRRNYEHLEINQYKV